MVSGNALVQQPQNALFLRANHMFSPIPRYLSIDSFSMVLLSNAKSG